MTVLLRFVLALVLAGSLASCKNVENAGAPASTPGATPGTTPSVTVAVSVTGSTERSVMVTV